MKQAIGIDLGTTFSCVAVYQPQSNQVDVIANDEGSRTTPSCVAFTQHERLVGQAAKNQAADNATNTVFNVKRLIGRRFDDPKVQDDLKCWPFEVVANENQQPNIQVEFKGEQKHFLPEQISAMVLEYMKEVAEDYLENEVTDVVISVPAYFNNNQRQATKDAARIAGLNVLQIINEPTAAAMAYWFKHNQNKGFATAKNLLVYDLGGGTFDVSILRCDGKNFEVKATTGDNHLGGEDFDNRLVRHFVDEIQQKHEIDLSNNDRALIRLRAECERAKRILSSKLETNIRVESLFNGQDFISKLTRACFEELCRDLFEKTLEHVKTALEDSKLGKNEIDEVILVGGSTRMLKIQEMLSEYFDGKRLNKSIHPDEAVAYGAAILASKHTQSSEQIRELIVKDVTPLSLGISEKGGLMRVLIERNTEIPVKKTKKFTTVTDDQTEVDLKVYEGERSMVSENQLLDEFTFGEIQPQPAGMADIQITFSIDANGILEVTAKDLQTFNSEKITVTKNGNLDDSEIERMIQQAEYFKIQDKQVSERVKARNRLESYAYEIRNDIKYHNRYSICQEAKDDMLAKVDRMIKWINENDSESTDEYKIQLKQLKSDWENVIKSQ